MGAGAKSAGAKSAEGGFSLVEVIMAIMILTVGVLGLAGTTALTVRQVTLAELATQRSAAFQTAVEQLRSQEWEAVGSGSTSVGSYGVSWWIDEDFAQSRVMKIETLGPGLSMRSGFPAIAPNVPDTFTYRLLRY